MPRTPSDQHTEDRLNLEALRSCGCLEPHEEEFIGDVHTDFQAKSYANPLHLLTPAQRRRIEEKIAELGLRAPSFASGAIPKGPHVDHLGDVPHRFRKPLKPPSVRR